MARTATRAMAAQEPEPPHQLRLFQVYSEEELNHIREVLLNPPETTIRLQKLMLDFKKQQTKRKAAAKRRAQKHI